MRRAHVHASLIAVFLLSACGGASFAEKSKQTLSIALSATTTAQTAFVSWDELHQKDLVASSSTREEAEAKLADYRAKRKKVIRAFTIAYSTMGAAAAIIPLVERGIKKNADLTKLLLESLAAAGEVKNAIDVIRGEP